MRSRNFLGFVLALVVASIQLIGCGGGDKQIVITGSLPSSGTVGTSYSGTLTASGGNGDFSWTVTGLPAGVSATGTDSATVSVSGTPTTAASYSEIGRASCRERV